MGRKNRQEWRLSEKRRLMFMWLDTAAKMNKDHTLFIPMKHNVERTYYVYLGKEIIREMETSFDKSIYHGLKVYSTSKSGILYLTIGRSEKIEDIAYIKEKHNKEKTLRLMVKSKHTRKAQINILLAEGYSKNEIRQALGDSITPEENLILEKL